MTQTLEESEQKIDGIVHASQLIDPEDMRINSSINQKGFYVRVSNSRFTSLMIEDWQEKFEVMVDKTILKSFDIRYNKEGDKTYHGTVVYEMAINETGNPCTAVLFISSGDQVFFHFWSHSFETSDTWCKWVKETFFVEKLTNVFDEVKNARDLTFWGQAGNEYSAFKRKVVLLDWKDSVEKNYPSSVRAQLEVLKDLKSPIEGGKIILLHGPPGTGKTSFLRTLSKQWTDWCHTSYITDPENFLGYSGSMLQVITWDYESYIKAGIKQEDAYHMLVIEDADSLIRQDAQERSGQAMSRLLNIGDGLLGQSTNLLIVITTNVDINNLNAAVSRAGRCLAQIHFGKFPHDEAIVWMKENHPEFNSSTMKQREYSLAELYQLVAEKKQIAVTRPEYVTGTYL